VISIPEDETEVDFKEFLNIIDNFNKEVEENIVKVSREEFRKKISIAPEFYIKRGYQKSTLNKFDVGLCLDKTERYFSRVVVPIYDEAGEYVIASMARSTQPYCKLCKKYHYENRHCPRNRLEEIWGEKWLNSSGWRRNTSLYNYWNAKKFIRESQTVVLVEGPGDVWRLDEAGIYNAVALYGMNMGPDQKVILEKSGAMKIIIAMDNDAAGLEGKKKIVQECSRMYNLEFINLKEHDIGDTGVEEIKEMFKENS
jgi:DNA primase